MKRFARAAALLVAGASSLLTASAWVVPSGTWAPTGDLSETRAGAAVVLLSDGVVLVVGGAGPEGPSASADRYGFSSGTFTPTAAMRSARVNHTATVLHDGRVLVIGGFGADGAAVAGAEIYDPATNAWQPSGTLMRGRGRHTATLLADGRVLVAGGENGEGGLATMEIYSPTFDDFLLVATPLTAARARHAAAVTGGKVLILGGWDGATALASADIYDPANDSVAAGPSMLNARAEHTATTLLDGNVLVAGGTNVERDLAAAEVFDAAAGQFVATPALGAARRNHLAILLPHNNSVLIAGGWSNGAWTPSAELYRAWQDGGIFVQTGSSLSTRSWSAGSALSFAASSTNRSGPADGLVIVAGGDGTPTAELYGFATVKTDKDDYSPGMTVRVSGSGWQPNQSVTFFLRELPAEHYARLFTIDADGSGNIAWTDLFVVEEHHRGVHFILTAADGVSQAQTAFTDGRAWTLSLAPTTGIASTTQSHTLTVTNTGDTTPPASNLEIGCVVVTAPADFTLVGLPSLLSAPDGTGTWTISRVGQVITAKANLDSNRLMIGNESLTFKIEATAPAATGPFVWTGEARNGRTCAGTLFAAPSGDHPTVTVMPSIENQTISVTTPAPASAEYSSSFNVAATGGGSGNPVAITTTGVCSGSGNDSASITMTSGVGTCVVHYNQTGNASFNPALEVTSNTIATQAVVSVTASGHSVTYGDDVPTVTASYAGFVNGETDAVLTTAPTCTTTYVDGSSVGGSPYPTSCEGAAAANYTFTYTSGGVTVVAASVKVTASSHTVTYGDAAPTVSASYTGFVNGETEVALTTPPTCTTTYVDGSPVAGSPYSTSCEGAAAANYTFTYTSGSVTVLAARVTVTASSHTVTYGDPVQTVTASYAGLVNGEADTVLTTSPTCTTSYVDGSPVADSPYPTSCEGAAAANYTFTYTPGGVTVLAASVTVTASSHTVTYGDAVPIATASYAGFVNGETEGILTTGPTCTTTYVAGSPVAGSPYATACAGALAANYVFSYTPGSVTVDKKALTITASSHTITFNDPVPAITPGYDGFVLGETHVALTTQPSCSTTYTVGSLIGTYPTSCTSATSGNYRISYVGGTITVLTACSVFKGFLSPIGGAVELGSGGTFADPVRAFKLNSTIPVKFSAICFGTPLVSGIHTLQATKASNATTYDTPIDATPTDAATDGNQFRVTGMEWHFNLSTKVGMSQGKWLLKATLFDGSSYSVWVEIKR